MLDLNFFREILSIDSTSGHEEELMAFLRDFSTRPGGLGRNDSAMADEPSAPRHSRACASRHSRACPWNLQSDKNFLLFSWGTPRVVFCTHADTVPPYIAPTFHREDGTPCEPQEAAVVRGRGACDAKGQLLALLTACRQLEAEGCTDFGLLLLTGEETGSWGAKAFAKTGFRAPYLIIGEPTENKMISASKGTKAYQLTFRGEAFHSGYPQYGRSAVDAFVEFYNALKAVDFGVDPVLGDTTWNIGRLASDNPQNILSPELTCRLYFRTTFVSDEKVQRWMGEIPGQARNDMIVEAIGGDTPAEYLTLAGFEAAPAAFGSDAPHLTNFAHKIICGPSSIRYAHRDDEHILVRDLEQAVEQYIRMYHAISALTEDPSPNDSHAKNCGRQNTENQ